ncbi:Galacturonokinase [Glycine soja]
MASRCWPSDAELNELRERVSKIGDLNKEEVRVVVSPYRICPLGAHIDHQGGIVSAMTINMGVLLGFAPSGSNQVVIRSGQFEGEVKFRVDEIQKPKDKNLDKDSSELQEQCNWGRYARGAVYALKSSGNILSKGIIGYICGSEGLDSSGLSSSAAVGVAYLMALQYANDLVISPTELIEYDRLIENEYLGLKNGIMDQSAILLSSHGCLMCMNCKTKDYKLVYQPKVLEYNESGQPKATRILLALSGLKQALTNNPGYNKRVVECREAAQILIEASGDYTTEPILSNVDPEVYDTHKHKLEPNLAKRAEHYFSENMRVMKGVEAWAMGNLKDFGMLITASGRSSIQNYECGCEPLIQLYEILLRAPGVLGARFSGAGFRGCCLAFVEADLATEAASFVRREYLKVQPELASQISKDTAVLICESGDCARSRATTKQTLPSFFLSSANSQISVFSSSLTCHCSISYKLEPSSKTTLQNHTLIAFFSSPFPSFHKNGSISVIQSKECSRTCESSFCSVPPLLRYGKYCGLLYSGCPGEKPCDGLDACCMYHDKCVQAKNNDYLSQECSQTFINCMQKFKNSRAPTFKGNACQVDDVIEVINVVMEAALLAGRDYA